jgi:hypothetical protein
MRYLYGREYTEYQYPQQHGQLSDVRSVELKYRFHNSKATNLPGREMQIPTARIAAS